MINKGKDKAFAAFVITYNRPQLLETTLSRIIGQTHPPEYILIIDNSNNTLTKELILSFKNPKILYHKVGYNSGPAGASRLGIEKLEEMGYKWIYWGDDNNPPRDENVFKRMWECIRTLEEKGEPVGLLAGKGGSFNSWTGRVRSLSNLQLKRSEILEVDVVPGGQTLFVNSEIIKEGLLPDKKLFFGFEDLDMSLKLKKSRFSAYVDAKTWLSVRRSYGNSGDDYRPTLPSKNINWNRKLYSTRNLLHIFYRQGFYKALIYTFLKSILKIPVGYFYGYKYGTKNSIVQFSAIKQFLTGKYQNNLKVD